MTVQQEEAINLFLDALEALDEAKVILTTDLSLLSEHHLERKLSVEDFAFITEV